MNWWLLALLAALADVITTLVGLSVGLSEGNLFFAPMIEASPYRSLIMLKGGALGIALAVSKAVPEGSGWAAPAGLAVSWGGVTVLNVITIIIST